MQTLRRLALPLIIACALAACSKDKPSSEAPKPQKTAAPTPAELAAAPADAISTESKLAYKVLSPGDGKTQPGPADEVKMHYTGWNADGSVIFSTTKIGRPATATVQRLFPGLAEGLQQITTGAKVRLWIPQALADKGSAGPVVYDVQLLSVVRGVGAPDDVAAPPEQAQKTESGLAYVVLSKGGGQTRPSMSDKVTVHYTGWTTDGQMFDSSYKKGEPATLPMIAVIPGWKEGLQLMQVGAKYRFWIPEPLAYQGRRAPHGMLVFDIELLEVK